MKVADNISTSISKHFKEIREQFPEIFNNKKEDYRIAKSTLKGLNKSLRDKQ